MTGSPELPRPTTVLGWAVVANGKILVRTVSDTRRAAMVNWLVTECQMLILADMNDEHVERLWYQASRDEARGRVEIDFVTVTRGNQS